MNTIWVGPPGWTGDITHTSLLSSLNLPAGSPYPAFNANRVPVYAEFDRQAVAVGVSARSRRGWQGHLERRLRLDFNGRQHRRAATRVARSPGRPLRRRRSVPSRSCRRQRDRPPTAGAAPPPGDAAVTESPNLGALEGVILANVTYVSPADQVIEGARHQCFVNFTHAIFEYVRLATPEERTAIEQEFPKVFAVLLSQGLSKQRTGFHWVDQLAACVAYVDAVEASRPGTQHSVVQRAAAASGSCAMSPIALSLTARARPLA